MRVSGGNAKCGLNWSQSCAREPYPCRRTTVGGPDPPWTSASNGTLRVRSHHAAAATVAAIRITSHVRFVPKPICVICVICGLA